MVVLLSSLVDVIGLCSDFSSTAEGFYLLVGFILFHEIEEEAAEVGFCTAWLEKYPQKRLKTQF